MRAIVDNSTIILENIPANVESNIRELLSYTDKAKQYEIKRLSRNPWSRNTPYLQQLQAQVKNCLLIKAGSDLHMPSGFFYLLPSIGISDIVDQRHITGKKVSLPWVVKPNDLRPYQQEALQLMLNNYRGIINFATGLGKTRLAISAVREIGLKTLIIVPGESIAKQFYEQLCIAFGSNKIGYFGGGKKKIADITVGIAASVNNNIETFKQADLGLVITDEVHHISADTFFSIATNLSFVGKMFGLTATDYRSDGKDIMINASCGNVLISRDIPWGVQNGFLSEPFFIVRGVNTQGFDYKEDKLKNYKAHVLNSQAMNDRLLADISAFMGAGKATLVLVDEVAHGKFLADSLGVEFATGVDKNSQQYVKNFNEGKTKCLVATDSKIGEGTDMPGVEVLVMANFTASKGPIVQCIGRGLRKTATKSKCLILDYKPLGSTMLSRHCDTRIKIYGSITKNVKVV